ncbi:macrolide ABC transporter ATP-binding protein [Cyanosarcina cf. burmensis CCALA 770]|nr:macrolide ABC transporter ATP-binding protein [Cyanosarcina cf. burmensis CCALA 770]
MGISPLDLLNLAYRSLRSHPVRSTLSMLGVFMGVAAVSATLQSSSISRAVIARQLAERGAPQITVYPQWEPDRIVLQLRLEDMEFLRQRLTGVQAISAFNWAGPLPTVYQDKAYLPSVSPVTHDYLLTSGKNLVKGRFFNATDFANYRPVAVIDEYLVKELFGDRNPVGEQILVGRRLYIVIGVLETRPDDDSPPEGQILVPMAIYNALHGKQDIGSVQLRPYRLEELEDLSDRAIELLEQRYPGFSFWAWNNVDDLIQQQQTLELATRGLMVVGAIALLVGGVGIANITIASVTERTSEIGIRRAVGATQREIALQFVLEAALLSLASGTVALVVVHVVALNVADAFDLPYEFEGRIAALALGSALVVGVGAGFPPALRASQLDPVQALRSQ